MFCLYQSVEAQGRPTGAQKNGELPHIGTVRKQSSVSPTMGLALGGGGHKPRIIHHMTEGIQTSGGAGVGQGDEFPGSFYPAICDSLSLDWGLDGFLSGLCFFVSGLERTVVPATSGNSCFQGRAAVTRQLVS